MNSDTPQKDELTSLLDQPVLVRFKKNNQQTFYAVLTDEAKHKLRSLLIRERITGLNLAATINYELSKVLAAKGMFGQDGQSALLRSTEAIAALETELEREEDV